MPLTTAVPLAGAATITTDENGPPVALAVGCSVTGAVDVVVAVTGGAVPMACPTTSV
ncbi:hypothetical protein GO290_04837 [Ralstonia solanacearum]|nr:hypothetical protein [Ralstonia solanacearum]NKF97720.1 hypothetical protein [Ralstonia solanacearum]